MKPLNCTSWCTVQFIRTSMTSDTHIQWWCSISDVPQWSLNTYDFRYTHTVIMQHIWCTAMESEHLWLQIHTYRDDAAYLILVIYGNGVCIQHDITHTCVSGVPLEMCRSCLWRHCYVSRAHWSFLLMFTPKSDVTVMIIGFARHARHDRYASHVMTGMPAMS